MKHELILAAASSLAAGAAGLKGLQWFKAKRKPKLSIAPAPTKEPVTVNERKPKVDLGAIVASHLEKQLEHEEAEVRDGHGNKKKGTLDIATRQEAVCFRVKRHCLENGIAWSDDVTGQVLSILRGKP